MEKKKVIVVGGGPGGYVAAIRAAQLGAEVHIVENQKFGGTCLNVGCIPTKALIHTAEIYRNVKESKIGVVAENVHIDLDACMKNKEAVVTRLVNGVNGLLRANQVVIHKGKARLLKDRKIKIDEKETIGGDIIIWASGSLPAVIPFPGHDLDGVIDSTAALSLKELPESMVLLGGGVIGTEFAFLFNALGVKVTVVEMLPRILPPVDSEISSIVRKELEAQGVTFLTSAKMLSVEKTGKGLHAVVEKDGKDLKLECDKVLVAVGRKPNTADMGLEEVGIHMNRAAIETNENFETSVRGVYAIGDCNAKTMLAHAASAQGIAAVESALGVKGNYNAKVIPSCIYTSPEAASVGLTEDQVKESGIKYRVGKFPLSGNGKAMIEGCTNGLIKMIVDEELDEILGVHMVGPRVTDMIEEAALAMHAELTTEDIGCVIHPHPTVSEAVLEAAHAVHGRSIHWPPERKK